MQTLDLSYNPQISDIPYKLAEVFNFNIVNDWNVKGAINIESNPIKFPPLEIIEQGQEAIKNYYESKDKQALNEVKLLLVGDGGAGKTSLVNRITKDYFNPEELQTHGINIDIWKVKQDNKNISVRVWDFGGQEIMHATHQFFLSKRSLYLLVLDGRKEENPEYWLKHIKTFGGDSKVLIVLNKYDEHPSFDLNRTFLQKKYPNIVDFFKVSCKDSRGVKELLKILYKELSTDEMIGTQFAKNWFDVKTYLENNTKDYISFSEYDKICENNDIDSKSVQNTLINFLNDLGIILHFDDLELNDTQVLNPKWLTTAVYKIINSDILAETKGVLILKKLDEILKPNNEEDYKYPKDKYNYIIKIMEKFKLCYRFNKDKILLPDLLEVNEPKFKFDYKNSLKFIFVYDFLPHSIVTQFIVNINLDIKDKLRWRTGVVIKSKDFNSTAVIKADIEDKKIFIFVQGKQKRDYFAYIRKVLLDINNSFEKLKYDEKIVINDNLSVSYQHLINLENMGEESFIPDGAMQKYSVKEFLGMVGYKREEKESNIEKADKIIEFEEIDIYGAKINTKNLIKTVWGFFKKAKK